MLKFLNVYKPKSQTPLQTILKLKQIFPEYQSSTLSYAGRVDQMAQGVILVLVDGENKHRTKYENFQKTYLTDVLFGITTDTYDPLGIINCTVPIRQKIDQEVTRLLPGFLGKLSQQYP